MPKKQDKKEFKKTVELSAEEVEGIINTDYGIKIRLQDVKAGHHIIMKILKPVDIQEYDHDGDTKRSHTFWCSYKPKDCEAFEINVQAGEGALLLPQA